jgi:hypothetical protein
MQMANQRHITGAHIIVDHSSNLLDPAAVSSVEANYNEEWKFFMAASHFFILLKKLEG